MPDKTKIRLIDAILISKVHNSTLVLLALQTTLIATSEKQLNWGKNCSNRTRYDRPRDFEIRNEHLPVSFLFLRSLIFLSLAQQRTSSIKDEFLSTIRIKQHDRSKKVALHIRKNNKFLADSFGAQCIPVYNSFLYNIILKSNIESVLAKSIKKTYSKRNFEGHKSI